MTQKKKIAILGGGVGAMSAAFELTNHPGWKERFDITVYQTGWRLGGKGASGRELTDHDRIEEHGLHMFLGFYDNAFRVMQAAYRELGRNPEQPLATWDAAFKPWSYFVLEQEVEGRMVPWPFDFPTNSDVPGTGGDLPSAWAYIEMMLGWMRELFESIDIIPGNGSISDDDTEKSLAMARAKVEGNDAAAPESDSWWKTLKDALIGSVASLASEAFLHLAHSLVKRMPSNPAEHKRRDHRLLIWMLRQFVEWLTDEIEETPETDIEWRRFLMVIDLGTATIIGMIEDELLVPPVNWFKIDDLDFEDWLMKHGAAPDSVKSPPVLLLREFVFATYDGVGAGTELHYALRLLFDYKGAFAWKMQAGMGDTIFTPFYEVLHRRGVKFEFFHRVDALELSADKKNIERIRIGRQVEPKGGTYDPLVDVKDLACWPARPIFDRIVDGDELEASGEDLENWWTTWQDKLPELVLERGTHYDEVVLGISIGAFQYICTDLIDDANNPKFKAMVEGVRTTQTQALQLWFHPDRKGLGWLRPEVVLGTNWEPFDTWADMTHLIERESWPPGMVGNLAYMCAQLPDEEPLPPRTDHDYPKRLKARVEANAKRWLNTRIRDIWPYATTTDDPNRLNYWMLVDPKNRAGEERFDAQYWRAVVSPSERYVQSVAGSVGHRLRAHDTGYDNLVMAGDYTLTSISAGCAEAAVMSGLHAAEAISGIDANVVGDWLPDDGKPPVAPAAPVAPATGPRYIEFDANGPPLAPYTAQDVTMYSYLLPADYGKLDAVCDRYLNLGGPIVYKPLGPFVAFVAADMPKMAPAAPEAWLSEKDFGFWMPVIGGRAVGGLFLPDRVAMFIPYLWVDDYLPCIAGREVFGYPKGVGELSMPSSPGDTAEVAMNALVVPEYGAVGNPTSEWTMKPLLRARKTDGGLIGELEDIWDNTTDLADGLIEMIGLAFSQHEFPVPTWDLVRAMYQSLTSLTVPMVFLKQFPSVENGTEAAYQAIVEAPNKVIPGPIKGGWLPGDWEMTIEQYASCRIIDNLGLDVDGGVIKPAFHFWVSFSFAAEPGKVVWRSR
jgi:uncharacterized protein with NAD-binding domain and iron-sulfur cluster